MKHFAYNSRPWLAASIMALLTLLTARAETIMGRFQYSDFNPAAGTSRLEPIRFCRVEVWSHRPRPPFGIWGWGNDANTTTDGNGRISVPFTFQTAGVTYGVKITAENYAAVVWPNSAIHTAPFVNEPGEPDGAKFFAVANNPGDVFDFSYNFTDTWTPQHWSMAEAVRHGFDFVTARRDPVEIDIIPKAAVQPSGVYPTFYNHVMQTITVNNAHVWEDYTMIHEYAHFLQHQIGSFAPIPSGHDGCTARDLFGGIINSIEHAWMEGFADFFAQAVATLLPPGTLQGSPGGNGTSTVSQLEDTPWSCSGLPSNVTPPMIENVVAGALWDLADAIGACNTGEAHDNLSGFATTIIQIMDREMDLPSWPSIFDFINAWNARGLPSAPMRDIMAFHGILSPSSIFLSCPANITVTAPPGRCFVAVDFPLPTLSSARRCATIACNFGTGYTFEIGTTTVTCTARENFQNIGTCSFTVTVNPGSQIPNPNGTGLLGVYYDDMNLSEPKAARTEAVDFDWGLGSPAPGVGVDTFSVRWSGQLVPRYTGTYTLYTISDDGVRLWVDGALMIDNWNDHAPTEDSRSMFLEAGQRYGIVMETYENTGGAVAKLMWASSCQPKEIIPVSHLIPAQLECPIEDRPTYPRDVDPRFPRFILFGDAVLDAGWLKLTLANNAYGIAYVNNFSGARPVFGFEASFKAALFGSLCCGGGAFPADGFSFNLVPEATTLPNPQYGQPAEEGLDQGLAICFDTWDNDVGEAPAIEVKWLGQVVARVPFQPSQSPAGVATAHEAARDVFIRMKSDGRLSLTYGGVVIFDNLYTPYSPNVIGIPRWVLGARNGLANDNHWIRDLRIIVNPPNIPYLFNTGLDNVFGHLLTDNAPDYNYRLVSGSAIVGAPLAATSAGGFPIGPWLADNSASAWITPTASTDGPGSAYYVYETTFEMNGLDPSEAMIQGWVAADDGLADILINGVSTGYSGPSGFTSWRAFTVRGGFQPGGNTLTFLVYNSGTGPNPTGLRVQMCGWAWTTPQLKLDIDHQRLVTTVSWGSLPNKTYFLDHAPDASGPWTRRGPITPGSYRAHYNDLHRFSMDPTRIYRVFEAP